MKLKKGELKVYYKTKNGIDIDLDEALAEVMKQFGYQHWASGISFITGVRDIAVNKIK